MSTRVFVTAGFTIPKVGERTARVEDRSHAHGRELVALMVEAHGDDSIGLLAVRGEKTVRMFR